MTLTVESAQQLVRARHDRPTDHLARLAVLTDVVLICAAIATAAVLRARSGLFEGELDTWSIRVTGPFTLGVWLLALAAVGSYRPSSFGAGTDEFKRLGHGSLLAAASVGITCFLLQWSLSRGYYVLVFASGVPFLLAGRAALRWVVNRARAHGRLSHRVLIAGSGEYVDEITRVFEREKWLGYAVVGSLVPGGPHAADRPHRAPVMGSPREAVQIVEAAGADVLFVAGGAFSSRELRRLAWDLEEDDVEVVVAPSVTDVAAERVRVRPVGGLPLIHLERPTTLRASRWLKRTFDLVCSTLVLALLGIPMLLIALWIRLDDGGEVLFRQQRVGKDGRPFTCLKFRSMVPDAERRLAALQHAQDFRGGLFKMKKDPRVTRPGRWLRRYSLDELPQLLNILRGDMSLVGPRPPLRREVEQYDDATERRLRVRPGLTGLWQVSGRSDLSWDESVRLDLYYVDNWSMLQDLSILARTVHAVLATRGAY
jgi:exopolysaccharide biosynthesis polyprenyl glycosylphosphotransferase